jgi:hypothetical protein
VITLGGLGGLALDELALGRHLALRAVPAPVPGDLRQDLVNEVPAKLLALWLAGLDQRQMEARRGEIGTITFLPPADASFQWESPTQIADRLHVTVQRVGKAITTLGLRGVEGMSRAIVNKASHSDRTVTTYLYSPEAVVRIEEYLLGGAAVSFVHP